MFRTVPQIGQHRNEGRAPDRCQLSCKTGLHCIQQLSGPQFDVHKSWNRPSLVHFALQNILAFCRKIETSRHSLWQSTDWLQNYFSVLLVPTGVTLEERGRYVHISWFQLQCNASWIFTTLGIALTQDRTLELQQYHGQGRLSEMQQWNQYACGNLLKFSILGMFHACGRKTECWDGAAAWSKLSRSARSCTSSSDIIAYCTQTTLVTSYMHVLI